MNFCSGEDIGSVLDGTHGGSSYCSSGQVGGQLGILMVGNEGGDLGVFSEWDPCGRVGPA